MLLAANNLFSKGIFLKQQEFSYIHYLGFHGELSSCKVLKRIKELESVHLVIEVLPLVRAIFNWMAKVIQCCVVFAWLHSVIGQENWHLSLNQLDAKLRPIMTWLPCCTFGFYMFLLWVLIDFKMYLPFWLAVAITLVFILQLQSIKKGSDNNQLISKCWVWERLSTSLLNKLLRQDPLFVL